VGADGLAKFAWGSFVESQEAGSKGEVGQALVKNGLSGRGGGEWKRKTGKKVIFRRESMLQSQSKNEKLKTLNVGAGPPQSAGSLNIGRGEAFGEETKH